MSVAESAWPMILPLLVTSRCPLPGETKTIGDQSDAERRVVAQLSESDGQLVLVSQRIRHSRARPMIGVLAAADEIDSAGNHPRAQILGLRRVEIIELTNNHGWSATVTEVDEGPDDEEAARRLERLARRLEKSDSLGILRHDRPPDDLSPGEVADFVASRVAKSEAVDIELVRATRWVDRVAVLERLSKLRREPRLRRGPGRQVADPDPDESLPPEIRAVVEQCVAGPGGQREAPGLVAAQILRELRWERVAQRPIELSQARQRLDESHLGLEAAKRAIADHLTLLEWQRRQGVAPSTGHALCLVGPPGVGKTSLAAVVAQVTGRRLEQLALGGIDGVALGGADRTYRNSRPGEIVRRLQTSRTHPSEVLWVLDEIDKSATRAEFSAVPLLLSMLDPEQNRAWQDRFLREVRLDLSGSIFLATANNAAGIPAALRDRLQVVQVPAYTQGEQIEIGQRRLAPRLLAQLGAGEAVQLEAEAIASLVMDHPRTPGCRQLEQRLRVVVARALERHMAKGRPVTVSAEMAKGWVPAAQVEAIGFRA